jgi:hypothetical protein
MFFGQDDLEYWYFTQHSFGPNLYRELKRQGVPSDQLDAVLYQRSIRNILSNPLQYAFLTSAEGCKLFFWESTKVGFVDYPPWMDRIYDFAPFKSGLRLLMFLLTMASLLTCIKYVWNQRMKIYDPQQNANPGLINILFIFIIIFANYILYAPFIVETRYGLPLASLYLVLSAHFLNLVLPKRGKNSFGQEHSPYTNATSNPDASMRMAYRKVLTHSWVLGLFVINAK